MPMLSDNDLRAHIAEISVISSTCANEAKVYAKYRAIGKSFNRNVEWLKDTSPPSISFFNGVTAMLDLSIVMSTWKLTETFDQDRFDPRPGEIVAHIKPTKRRKHDEVRSLPRLAWLFRSAFADNNYAARYAERQREIAEQFELPPRAMDDYAEKIRADREQLCSICSSIDSIVSSSAHNKLDIIRNEGFAHSSAISRKFIQSGMGDDDFDFTRSALFAHGDLVMQTALDFDSIWNQQSRATIDELIKLGVDSGSQFWQDLKKGLYPDAGKT